MVLAGLEKHVKGTLPAKVTSKNLKYPKGDSVRFSRKINIVRYADDFIITCRNKIEAKALIESVNVWSPLQRTGAQHSQNQSHRCT